MRPHFLIWSFGPKKGFVDGICPLTDSTNMLYLIVKTGAYNVAGVMCDSTKRGVCLNILYETLLSCITPYIILCSYIVVTNVELACGVGVAGNRQHNGWEVWCVQGLVICCKTVLGTTVVVLLWDETGRYDGLCKSLRRRWVDKP